MASIASWAGSNERYRVSGAGASASGAGRGAKHGAGVEGFVRALMRPAKMSWPLHVADDSTLVSAEAQDRLKRRVAGGVTPVVLLDMGVSGLALARSLGRRGVPVIALDTKSRHWTHATRYADVFTLPGRVDDDQLIRVLDRLAMMLGQSSVLVPLHDDYVRFVSTHRAALSKNYRFALPSDQLVKAITDKPGLYRLCARHGIPVPTTFVPASREELEVRASTLRFPLIFKPAQSRRWQSESAQALLHGRKAVEVGSVRELLEWYEPLRQIDPGLMVQEVVPGEDSNLYYVVSYVSQSGDPFGFFVGRKWRIYPIHFGQGSYVESVHAPELVERTSRLIGALGCRGNLGVEYKYDRRDGSYKLIEINTRFGLWDGFAADCGLDFGRAMYADLTGQRWATPRPSYRAGKFWLDLERDIWAFVEYRRRGLLSFLAWIRTVLRPHASPTYAIDDLRPAFVRAAKIVFDLVRRAGVRIRRRLTPALGK